MTVTKSDFEPNDLPRMIQPSDALEFRTMNSCYQIENMKVRRLSGAHKPTVRVGTGWRQAVEISYPVVGGNVLIMWRIRDGAVLETTLTSIVESVTEIPIN